MIIADTNIIVHFLFPSEPTKETRDLFAVDVDWYAPAIWRSEFRNVLWKLIRHRKLSLTAALELIPQAEEIVKDATLNVSSESILCLATESGCSPYDCEFVAIAQECKCPMVTFDKAILKAFPSIAFTPAQYMAIQM